MVAEWMLKLSLSMLILTDIPATTEIYPFPYTTLFRSPAAFPRPRRAHARRRRWRHTCATSRSRRDAAPPTSGSCSRPRSEEHTSELQSRLHLVCRLLLEKKKPMQTKVTQVHA